MWHYFGTKIGTKIVLILNIIYKSNPSIILLKINANINNLNVIIYF